METDPNKYGGLADKVKQGLRQQVMQRIKAEGKERIILELLYTEPREEIELTKEEVEKFEWRRSRNRIAAKKFREKRKHQQADLNEITAELKRKRGELLHQIEKLAYEKAALSRIWKARDDFNDSIKKGQSRWEISKEVLKADSAKIKQDILYEVYQQLNQKEIKIDADELTDESLGRYVTEVRREIFRGDTDDAVVKEEYSEEDSEEDMLDILKQETQISEKESVGVMRPEVRICGENSVEVEVDPGTFEETVAGKADDIKNNSDSVEYKELPPEIESGDSKTRRPFNRKWSESDIVPIKIESPWSDESSADEEELQIDLGSPSSEHSGFHLGQQTPVCVP